MTEAERQMKDALTLLHMAVEVICEATQIDIEGTVLTLRLRNKDTLQERERDYRLSDVLMLSSLAAELVD